MVGTLLERCCRSFRIEMKLNSDVKFASCFNVSAVTFLYNIHHTVVILRSTVQNTSAVHFLIKILSLKRLCKINIMTKLLTFFHFHLCSSVVTERSASSKVTCAT
jgi:hypothetical protein